MDMEDFYVLWERPGQTTSISGSPSVDINHSYYSYDGSHNHPKFTQRGAFGTPRIRTQPPLHSYSLDNRDDEEGEADKHDDDEPLWFHPRLDLPSPRKILVELFQKVTPRPNPRSSQLLITFGHFVRLDITRTIEYNTGQPMPIECDMVETRGPYCPAGQEEMEFFRAFRSLDGTLPKSSTGEPINFATTWLDMDHIYGNAPPSSPDYLRYRTGTGGRMKFDYSTKLPPIDPETGQYLVSYPSVRQLPSDLAMAATFLHYHNKRAEYHQQENPESDDETLFHKARMDTLAVYQYTFETKYIPALLGEPLSDYKGYGNMTDATIDVFFSTSSFRYGHSGISNMVRLLDDEYEPLTQDPMVTRDVFNRTEDIVRLIARDTGGNISLAMAAVMRGLTNDVTRAPDASFVDDMSLFMAGSVVKNVQRGRDNGLPSYNDARGWFLRRMEEDGMDWKELGYKDLTAETYLDLAQGDEDVAKLLEALYGEGNVDDVDAYVGAMLENPVNKHHKLGPLNEMSIREQFERLRNGDRLYFRARLNQEEIQELDTLTDLVQDVWGKDEMRYFPEDTFAIVSNPGAKGSKVESIEGLSKLDDGDLMVRWEGHENDYVDFTMFTPNERVNGGYIGLGWNSRSMKGAEIWFCDSRAGDISSQSCFAEDGMTPRENPFPDTNSGPFSCCVADGKRHVRPICGGHNYLSVLDSCSSDDGSFVTVRAKVCSEGEADNCFSHKGDLEMIAAYNPTDVNAAHGFSRRSSGIVNLALGTASTCTDDSAQAGLFALHGATLLIAWLVLAPIAIFVVRYLKDKPWRLRVHITLVGVIGGLMLTLVTAALVSVEGTSFGTVDAESATPSRHKIFGLSIVFFVVFMIVTGELRRRGTLSKKTTSVALERAVIISHRCGGLLLTGVAWYNCYTGLVQIGPYESDSVEVTFLSSQTVSLGYDLEFFGFIRKYLYIPWLCFVILIFLMAEAHHRLARRKMSDNINSTVKGVGGILLMDSEHEIPEMTVKTFLFLTKHGNSLSILDGYVIDIHDFMDVHPGGTNVLRFAVGCDITPYFVGELDINGMRHKHSHRALRALRPLVKWKLEGGSDSLVIPGRKEGQSGSFLQRTTSIFNQAVARRAPLLGHVFRNATIVRHEIISPRESVNEKCVIRLGISLNNMEGMDISPGTPLPTTTFVFRAVDSQGSAFERPYTTFTAYYRSQHKSTRTLLPLLWNPKSASGDIVYEFFITLIPGGKMSTFLEKKTVGKNLMVKGPMASEPFLEKLRSQPCTDICLITQGTGVTPGLQLVDYYLRMPNPPNITLLWLFRDRDGRSEWSLKLPDRQRASDKFKYLIVRGRDMDAAKQILFGSGLHGQSNNGSIIQNRIRKERFPLLRSQGTRDLIRDEEKEDFLKHYHSQGILHKDTVHALLTWACTADKSDEGDCTSSVDGEDEQFQDITLTHLARIGKCLRTDLELRDDMVDYCNKKCFRGSDAVSVLVEKGYTISRGLALDLGRELSSKLNYFRHATDAQKIFLDDPNELYSFCNTMKPCASDMHARATRHLNLTPGLITQQVLRRTSEAATRNLMTNLNQGVVVALCGHSSFEGEMSDALESAGFPKNQIFRFPEGSEPLSKLSEFAPEGHAMDAVSSSQSSAASRQNWQPPLAESITLPPISELHNQSSTSLTDDILNSTGASSDSIDYGKIETLQAIRESSEWSAASMMPESAVSDLAHFETDDTTGSSGDEAVPTCNDLKGATGLTIKDEGQFNSAAMAKGQDIVSDSTEVTLTINNDVDVGGDNEMSSTRSLMENVKIKANNDSDFKRNSTRIMTRSNAHALMYKADGDSAFRAGHYERAIECYTKAIGIDGDNAIYFSNRSAAYRKIGDNLSSIKDANTSIKLDPKLPKGHLQKVEALIALKCHDEAISAFEVGRKNCPNDAMLQDTSLLGKVLTEKRSFPTLGSTFWS